MFVRNEAIDSEVRLELKKMYGSNEAISNLRRLIKKWFASEWSINFFGMGSKVKLSDDNEHQPWIDKVDVLEEVIFKYSDDSSYFVVFDELDEDYSSIIQSGGQSNYISLVTSLFKAVQDIKSVFNAGKIKPVIFLRDDIYDLITDSDKTKWNDFKLDLDWNPNSIKNLLAFRLTRAENPNQNAPDKFGKAWNQFFTNGKIKYGTKQQKEIDMFTYMSMSTQYRPRDYVRYLQACADQAIEEKRSKITPSIVKQVDKAFSNYLKEELIDEIHGILPDIKEVLMVISEIRKWNFTIEEFKLQYQKAVDSGSVKTSNPDLVLKILFHFSVVGNQPKNQTLQFFRYKNKESRFNFNERVVVHRGLFKALQIL